MQSPVTLMARLALQKAISPEWVDQLFEQPRQHQYTRELLFSSVELMSLVAAGMRPSSVGRLLPMSKDRA